MLVEYGASWFTHEIRIDTTQTCDVGDDSILALDYYREGKGVEYSLKHEDSMEANACIDQESEKRETILWEKNSTTFFRVGTSTWHNTI
jgi:hypothetical protein